LDEEIAQVGGGLGGLGGVDSSRAGGPEDGFIQEYAVLPQTNESGKGLAGQDGAIGSGQFFRGEGGGEAAELVLDAALALGFAGAFLEAALGIGIGVGLRTDGGGKSSLGMAELSGEQGAEKDAEEPMGFRV